MKKVQKRILPGVMICLAVLLLADAIPRVLTGVRPRKIMRRRMHHVHLLVSVWNDTTNATPTLQDLTRALLNSNITLANPIQIDPKLPCYRIHPLNPTNGVTPPPPLALPLPSRLLTGLGILLYNPCWLVPLALIFAASRVLALKLNRSCCAAIALAGLMFVMLGAFWVPNPILFWPISVLGEHTVLELVGELFTFHIVPAPEVGYLSSAGFDSLIRWQLMEIGARFGVIIIGSSVFLAAIWRIARRRRAAHPRGSVHPSDSTA
jgi:hypothetical protein